MKMENLELERLKKEEDLLVKFSGWLVVNANPIFPNKHRWNYNKDNKNYSTQEMIKIFKDENDKK